MTAYSAALTLLYAAASPEVQGMSGRHIEPAGVVLNHPPSLKIDQALASKLWKKSFALSGQCKHFQNSIPNKNQFVYAFTHQSLFIHSISKHVSDYFSFLFISKSIHLSFSLFLMYPIYMLS